MSACAKGTLIEWVSVKGISKLLLTGLLSQGLCRLRLLRYLLPTYSRAVGVVSEEHFAVVFKISGYTKMHSIVHACTFAFCSVSKLFIVQRSKVFTLCFLCCLFMHIVKKSFLRCCFQVAGQDCYCYAVGYCRMNASLFHTFTVGNFRKCFRLSDYIITRFRVYVNSFFIFHLIQ